MHTDGPAILADFAVARNGVPIYVQLRDHFATAIQGGRIGSGDQMPTMRQVAVAVRIDINTVRHAYEDLERAGLITLARGRGSFVAGGDVSPPLAAVDELALQMLKSARIAGINPITLANRVVALAQTEESS